MQIGLNRNFLTTKPDVIDSKGPGWSVKRITKAIADELTTETGTYLTRSAKVTATDYTTAAEIAENAEKMFKRNVSNLMATTEDLQSNIKKVSGNVRKARSEEHTSELQSH